MEVVLGSVLRGIARIIIACAISVALGTTTATIEVLTAGSIGLLEEAAACIGVHVVPLKSNKSFKKGPLNW